MSTGATIELADERFGILRQPNGVKDWERDNCPRSISQLDAELGTKLAEFRDLSQNSLFRSAAQCFQFIWVMDADCAVHIAYEELVTAEIQDYPFELKLGHPRRKGYPSHPASEKKLGHPALIGCATARVAGELFLDEEGEKLHWYVRCQSGRYCGEIPPTSAQEQEVHRLFMDLIDDQVRYDPVNG